MNELVIDINTRVKLINDSMEQNDILAVAVTAQVIADLANKLSDLAKRESLFNNEDYVKWFKELD